METKLRRRRTKPLPKGIYKRGEVYYSCIAGADGRMIRQRLSEDLGTAKTILADLRHKIDLQKAGVIEEQPVKAYTRLEEVRRGYQTHLMSGKASTNTVDIFNMAWSQVIHKNSFVVISDLTLTKVEQWAAQRLTAKKTRGQTINLYVGHVNRAMKWALSRRHIRRNPLAEWEPVRINEPMLRRDLTQDEISALFGAEEDPQWRVRWFVYLFTGLRKTAGMQLRWEWLDWDAKTLHLPTEFNKSRKPLDLPLHNMFYGVLKSWHDRQGNPTSGMIFDNTGVDRTMINRRLRRLCEAAGVDPTGVTPHSFRHTFATMIFEVTGRNIKAVQEFLGHASSTTSMRYLHLSPEEKKQAINKLEYELTGLPL